MKHCSRICCTQAVKNALKIKEIKQDINIYILYRDMRTYGFYEEAYREARKKGVKFLRYSPDQKPEVIKQSRGIKVRAYDRLLGEDIEIPASLVVLSSGIAPEDNGQLAKALKAPLTSDGFFLEAHAKLRPVEVAVDGVYLCGLAHGPKSLEESVAQAKAAAAKATIPLAKGKVAVAPIVSRVNQDVCIGCGICESLCPFNAIRLTKVGKRKKAETITASCKGCGICASHCPTLAISMGGFTDEAIMAQIHAFSGEECREG
jgi:heterodisulfide reductase subunit A